MAGPDGVVTLRDVARAAGVSTATASRALNDGPRTVGPALREQVLAAAERLGYTANAQAQAMVRGSTSVLGLVVHDIADPYFAAIAAGVTRAADRAGLLVLLCNTDRRAERQLDYLHTLRAQRGRAVILVGSQTTDADHQRALDAAVAAYRRGGGRVVAVSQPWPAVDTVVIENAQGAAALARRLTALGYRRFGVLSGPEHLLTARDRTEGFQAACRELGLPTPRRQPGPFTRDGGYEAMTRLLAQGSPPDCVFCVNDVMAMGALSACRDAGLRVPQDLALAGFDDIATLRDISPPLTTVRLPLADLGERAMRLLSQPEPASAARERVAGEVVLRASTPDRR